MTKTEQAWQRVKDAHDTMMEAYQEYLDIAQEEGVLPKIGHVYLEKCVYESLDRDIVLEQYTYPENMPIPFPNVKYRTIINGIKGSRILVRCAKYSGSDTLIYKGKYGEK